MEIKIFYDFGSKMTLTTFHLFRIKQSMNNFIFYRENSEIVINIDDNVVIIPKKIQQKHDLIHFISSNFNFSFYFEKNWDVLYDCLRDLSWIEEFTIIVVHEDLPLESIYTEKKIYRITFRC